MSVLIAPIRVIVSVVSHPVSLIGRSSLRCALRRVSPSRERQRMSVVPFLLNAEEIRQCVVECTLYISLFSPAISEVGSHCPSPFVETGCVGVHRTHGVVAVRSAQSDAVSRRHTACAEVVVVASRCATHREVVSLERQRIVHVACLLVQTAHERIAELSALHIIGQHAIDIDIVVFLVKSTITETYRREQIAHFRCVNVRV